MNSKQKSQGGNQTRRASKEKVVLVDDDSLQSRSHAGSQASPNAPSGAQQSGTSGSQQRQGDAAAPPSDSGSKQSTRRDSER